MEDPCSSTTTSYSYVISNSAIAYCITQIDKKIKEMESSFGMKEYHYEQMSKLPKDIEGDMQMEKLRQKVFQYGDSINKSYNEFIVYIGFIGYEAAREKNEERKKQLENWKQYYLRKSFKCLGKEALAAALVIPSPS